MLIEERGCPAQLRQDSKIYFSAFDSGLNDPITHYEFLMQGAKGDFGISQVAW